MWIITSMLLCMFRSLLSTRIIQKIFTHSMIWQVRENMSCLEFQIPVMVWTGRHWSAYSTLFTPQKKQAREPALSMGEAEQGQELEEEAVIRGGHETVLIVDDEETLRDQGRDMLNKYGYTSITAESGEKAIEIYKRENDRIDLVVLDIGMPGMGGYKCMEQLFKIDPEIKVIVASGYTTGSRVEEMLKSGAAGFIGKPYLFTDMLKKVREVLDQDRRLL